LLHRPGGAELVIAFYRGLLREHLNVLAWRGDGAGSFEPKPREYGLQSGEEADRSFLVWADATGDGTTDLVTIGGGQAPGHAGTPGERPVEETPTAFFAFPRVQRGTVTATMDEGGLRFAYAPGRQPVFRDVDGDGRPEMLTIEYDPSAGAPAGEAARKQGRT